MDTPFEILGIDEDADDEAIKKAYLRAVRACPPERDADAFRRVREAYELISDEKQRHAYRLFHYAPPDLAAALRRAVKGGVPERPDAATLIGAFQECVRSARFGTRGEG